MGKKNLLKEIAQFAPRSYSNVSGAPTPVDSRMWLDLMLDAKNKARYNWDPELLDSKYWYKLLDDVTKKMMSFKGNSAGYEGRRNWILTQPDTGLEFQFESGTRTNAESQAKKMLNGWETFDLNEVYGPQDWTHYRTWPNYRFDSAIKKGMIDGVDEDIRRYEQILVNPSKWYDWLKGKERKERVDEDRKDYEAVKAIRSRLDIPDEQIQLDPLMYSGDEYPYWIRNKANKIISGED